MPKRTALLLIPLFVVSIGLTFLFAFRVGRQARSMNWDKEPIRPWMSVPFIAHTHHVPAHVLFQAIRVEPHPGRDRRPLRRLAREQKRPVDDLIRELNDAIAHERATNPSPGKGP